MSDRTSRAISGTISSFIEFVLRLGLQVALAPLLLHVAGQETLGVYGILVQLMAYLALVDLGFGVALGRYMAQAIGYDDQKERFIKIFNTGRTFYLVSNTLIAFLSLVLTIFIGDLFSLSGPVEVQARISLSIFALWSILRTPLSMYGSALIATQNLAAANFINMIGNSIRLIISLAMIFLGFGLIGLILANVFAEFFTFFLQRLYYLKTYPDENFGWGIPSWSLFREMFGFGIGYLFITISARLVFNTGNVVVGYLYGGVATSIYYTTQMPTFLIMVLIWKITENAAPALHELYARKEIEKIQNTYYRLIKYVLMLSLGAGIGILVLNKALITLWVGENQYAGSTMTISLVIFLVCAVINHVTCTILVVYGAVRVLSVICFVLALSNLVLSIVLGKILGMEGVMVAGAVVETVSVVVVGLYGILFMRINLFELLRKAAVPAILTNFFVIPVAAFIYFQDQSESVAIMMSWSFIFLIIWSIGSFTAGLNKKEIAQIRGYIESIVITNT